MSKKLLQGKCTCGMFFSYKKFHQHLRPKSIFKFWEFQPHVVAQPLSYSIADMPLMP